MHLQINNRIFAILLASAMVLCGCAKQNEELSAAIEIVSSNLHAGPDGGVTKAVFRAKGAVEAESNMPQWCAVAINRDTLEVNCKRNNTISERHAVITLSCLGEKTSVVLSQDGQYTSLLEIPEFLSVDCSEARISYDIQTNARIKSTCDAEDNWCRVGVSNTMVMFTLTANPNMDARQCNVTLSTDSKEMNILVRQKGRFVFERTEPVVFPKHGGKIAIEFYSAEPYTISVDDDWVEYSVKGDSLYISAALSGVLAPSSSALHITTESGHTADLDVLQRLLPEDYVGPYDFCFRTGWEEKNQIYEYAVDAIWDEEAGQVVFDLVSYVLHFDYDPSDGQLYLSPQRAYVSTTQPYDTWLSIVGTEMLADGSPDPASIVPSGEITDWTNYYPEGATFRKDYRMLFKWNETMDKMTMTHCAESDFPVYNSTPDPDNAGRWIGHYGDEAFLLKRCYAFRLALNHVYYNSMEDDRIDPDYAPGNRYPDEYRVDEHLPMYGPITLVRK